MLNHAGRSGWTLHEGTRRPGVLGRAAGGKALRLPSLNRYAGADEDEAPTSTETQSKMHEAIARLGAGAADAAGAGAAQAIDEVIRSFRKDNAMGGRGVFEHLPLPHELARTIASYFDNLDEREKQPAFNEVISQLEPSVRTHVAQQVAGVMGTLVKPLPERLAIGREPAPPDEPQKLGAPTEVGDRYRVADALVQHALRPAEDEYEESASAEPLGGRSLVNEWERPRDSLTAVENGALWGTSSNVLGSSRPRAPSKAKAYKMQGHDAMGRPFVRRIFELEEPADSQNGGYIVQTVTVEFFDANGKRIHGPITWSEAWRVGPGKYVPEDKREIMGPDPAQAVPAGNDSIRPTKPLPPGVTMVVRVSWRFYDNVRTLPPAFRRWPPKDDHPAGNLLATKPGTVADPASIGGTPGPEQSDVFRLQQR